MASNTQYADLAGKKVLITGGASGIGAVIVSAFLEQGAKVTFLDRDEKAAVDLLERLGDSANQNVHFKKVDICDGEALKSAVDWANERMGGIDIVINNAANDARHDWHTLGRDEWHSALDINLSSVFFTSQHAARYLSEGAAIINFSSLSALKGMHNMMAYNTAKAGVVGLTKSLANELGERGVRVNALIPGWVATQRQLETWFTVAQQKEWMQDMALKKRILPSDIAKAVLFFSSSDSAMITGQCLVIDGGKY